MVEANVNKKGFSIPISGRVIALFIVAFIIIAASMAIAEWRGDSSATDESSAGIVEQARNIASDNNPLPVEVTTQRIDFQTESQGMNEYNFLNKVKEDTPRGEFVTIHNLEVQSRFIGIQDRNVMIGYFYAQDLPFKVEKHEDGISYINFKNKEGELLITIITENQQNIPLDSSMNFGISYQDNNGQIVEARKTPLQIEEINNREMAFRAPADNERVNIELEWLCYT